MNKNMDINIDNDIDNNIDHNSNKSMDKKKRVRIIVIVCIGVYILGAILSYVIVSTQNEGGLPVGGYYIGETLNYEDIDILVTGVTCNIVTDSNSDYYGLNSIKVYFTCKNNRTKDFSINPKDIVLKTEDKNEEYTASVFSIDEPEKIIPGVQKYYFIGFYTPYTFSEKRFKMVLDWGIWSYEEEYHLYYRDGTNYIGTPPLTDSEKIDEELKNTLLELQSDLYAYFRDSVYEEIDGSMYYSDVQYLMDLIENTFKSEGVPMRIILNLSQGSYRPRWDITVKLNGATHYLMFIEVQCTSSYKVDYKYIGSYTIQ